MQRDHHGYLLGVHVQGRRLALLLACAAALSACGGSSGSDGRTAPTVPTVAVPTANGVPPQPSVPPTTLPPQSSTTPAPSGAAPAGNGCATSQLTAEVTAGQGAAGTEYSGITFRNRSSSTCTLQGYPGVSLLDQSRNQIGEPAKRVPASDPVVVLAPGQSATASFSVAPAACGNAGPPAKSAYLRIFPPNQRADIVISAQVYPCAPQIRPVHPGAHITP